MSLYMLFCTLQYCRIRRVFLKILNYVNLKLEISKHPSNEPWGVRLRYQVASQVWVNLFKHLQVVSKIGFYDNALSLWGKPVKEGQVQGVALFFSNNLN